jgi:hypothetical protein
MSELFLGNSCRVCSSFAYLRELVCRTRFAYLTHKVGAMCQKASKGFGRAYRPVPETVLEVGVLEYTCIRLITTVARATSKLSVGAFRGSRPSPLPHLRSVGSLLSSIVTRA